MIRLSLLRGNRLLLFLLRLSSCWELTDRLSWRCSDYIPATRACEAALEQRLVRLITLPSHAYHTIMILSRPQRRT